MSVTYNVYRDGEQIVNGLTSKTYTDTGLTPDTEYKYQVSASNEYGESPLSTVLTIRTLPIPTTTTTTVATTTSTTTTTTTAKPTTTTTTAKPTTTTTTQA